MNLANGDGNVPYLAYSSLKRQRSCREFAKVSRRSILKRGAYEYKLRQELSEQESLLDRHNAFLISAWMIINAA
jgi:hypothetical protein